MIVFGIFLMIAVVYTIGLFTGVYVTRSMHKELEVRKKRPRVPNEEDTIKILAMLGSKKKITNNDVEKLLDVSDATATRYLDNLEERGDIVQHGKTGRDVYYTRP